MSQWQPIDTAPLDGTDILLFMPELGGAIIVGYYRDRKSDWPWATMDGPLYHKEAPTHWMPLPPCPEEGPDPVGGSISQA